MFSRHKLSTEIKSEVKKQNNELLEIISVIF